MIYRGNALRNQILAFRLRANGATQADLDRALEAADKMDRCANCNLPESLHADAGGARGLDGCQKFEVRS